MLVTNPGVNRIFHMLFAAAIPAAALAYLSGSGDMALLILPASAVALALLRFHAWRIYLAGLFSAALLWSSAMLSMDGGQYAPAGVLSLALLTSAACAAAAEHAWGADDG